jgi:hypothetical protein
MAVPKFERFFRAAAGLDIDKNDIKRYDDFIGEVLNNLILMGRNTAKANARDIIQPQDLPITKGLQERIHEFEKLDQEIGLESILEHLAARPPLDVTVATDTEEELPRVVGGISVALARLFTLTDPKLANPQTEDWERAFRVFELLL